MYLFEEACMYLCSHKTRLPFRSKIFMRAIKMHNLKIMLLSREFMYQPHSNLVNFQNRQATIVQCPLFKPVPKQIE